MSEVGLLYPQQQTLKPHVRFRADLHGRGFAPSRVRGQLTKKAGRDFSLARKVKNVMNR